MYFQNEGPCLYNVEKNPFRVASGIPLPPDFNLWVVSFPDGINEQYAASLAKSVAAMKKNLSDVCRGRMFGDPDNFLSSMSRPCYVFAIVHRAFDLHADGFRLDVPELHGIAIVKDMRHGKGEDDLELDYICTRKNTGGLGSFLIRAIEKYFRNLWGRGGQLSAIIVSTLFESFYQPLGFEWKENGINIEVVRKFAQRMRRRVLRGRADNRPQV